MSSRQVAMSKWGTEIAWQLDCLFDKGLSVFPIVVLEQKNERTGGLEKRRIPIVNSWQDKAVNSFDGLLNPFIHEKDEQESPRWYSPTKHILGVVMDNVFVVDVDQHEGNNEERASAVAKRFVDQYGLPKTFTVRSKRGGYHMYFRPKGDPKTALNGYEFSSRGFKRDWGQIDIKKWIGFCYAPVNAPHRVVRDVPIAEVDEAALFSEYKKRQYKPQRTYLQNTHYSNDALERAMRRLAAAEQGDINNSFYRFSKHLGHLGYDEATTVSRAYIALPDEMDERMLRTIKGGWRKGYANQG